MVRSLGCLIVLAAAAGMLPVASHGDSGSPNYRSKLVTVAPVTKGLVVRVVDGDDALELRNTTGRNVMVPGYEGEPYLRFLAGGRVEVNVNSPAKYLNEERYGGVTVPETASAKSTPRWQPVAQGGRYVWHEHRIHWMSTIEPPRVKASGGKTLMKVFDWAVPLKVGAKRVKVNGTLWWIPTGQLGRADALIAAAVAKQARGSTTAPASKPADSVTPTPAPTPDETVQDALPATPPDDGSSGALLWVVVGVLVAALAGAGIYIVHLRRRDPGAPKGEVW